MSSLGHHTPTSATGFLAHQPNSRNLSARSDDSKWSGPVPVALPSPLRSRPGTDASDFDGEAASELPYSPSERKRHLSSDAGTSVVMYLDGGHGQDDAKKDIDAESDVDEDSPYPEVRVSVSNIDDPSMPCMTFRMWAIGMTLCLIGGAVNVFFNFRQPAPQVIPLVLLLISHPIGKFCAYALPLRTWRFPSNVPYYGGSEFSLNPGPFNVKEHVLIYIMANVSIMPPYALSAIVVAEAFYGMKLSFWFNLTLVLATQLTGFGLAGLCRRFLVWPASMIWPQNLVACTLLNTLHAEDESLVNGGGITRFKFFCYAFVATFAFMFLPGYLFTALSTFSWICWFTPNNRVVNQLFGVESGLGMGLLTFDWAQITWVGSPLMVPWWAEVHVMAGFVLFYWILCPIMYYTNVWELAHFPIFSSVPYDRFGDTYNVSRVLMPGEMRLNVTAYEEYSPLYMPAGWVITYLLAFAVSTCVVVHTALYHGEALVNGLKRMRVEKDDIHAKLMRNYPEVPDWWYLGFFVFFFCLAIIAVERWHTDVPVWALLLALLLPVIYILPGGFIFAMTGQPITLNLLAQIIPGTLLPGNLFANMVFKVYAIQTHVEAIGFVQDLKLGHYIKVPPRASFIVQSSATIIAAFVQVGVKQWMFANVEDICKPHQKDALTCPHTKVFFTASAIWGLIGPTRQFGKGSLYHPELYALVFGALIPLPFWLWQRKYPQSRVKLISMPIVLNGVSQIPPATGINYSSWFLVAFVFQYVVRRTRFAWWSKFNYVLSSALDSGTVVAIIAIFFCLQFPKGIKQPQWWGNNVYLNTRLRVRYLLTIIVTLPVSTLAAPRDIPLPSSFTWLLSNFPG
ncbi:OPT-domain-containing protein [Exidia glandulosa HHB12029]|uniref:OPT-domain-containing protein n=1 Tax=Exidia glandulosa HHB12029 TaxID=1314781 RepID=A0A165ZV55_EXIGL|nr:OPT-domain-containing protein [Exidia glandulosa HHB12029]